MHLLHKGCFGVHQSIWPQHSIDFCNATVGIDDMFEYSLSDDAIKCAIIKRKIMYITYHVRAWT